MVKSAPEGFTGASNGMYAILARTAKPGCKECFGRGFDGHYVVGQTRLPNICECVRKQETAMYAKEADQNG